MPFLNLTHRWRKYLSGMLVFSLIVSLFYFSFSEKTDAQFVSDEILAEIAANTGETAVNTGFIADDTIQISIATKVIAAATKVSAVNNTLQSKKAFVLDAIAWSIAKMIIRQITAATVNWINSGFQGNPAYVTDPGQFFLNVGDRAAGIALASNSALSNALCTPFKAQIRIALLKSYMATTDPVPSCTITKIIANYDAFTRDFTQGGWTGWISMTQNDSNNPYGAFFQAQSSLTNQVFGEKDKYVQQLAQGKGFLSLERCKAPYVGAPPQDPKTCQKETITPGSVIETQLENVVGSPVRQLELANSINQVVSALLVQMFQHVVGGLGSLRGLSESGSANQSQFSSLADQLGNTTDIAKEQAQNTTNISTNYNTAATDATTAVNNTENQINKTNTGGGTTLTGPTTSITLVGNDPMYVLVNATFIDPGAIASDVTDGDISQNVIATGNTFDTSVAGVHTVTYTVTNSQGTTVSITRTVDVVNVLPDSIQNAPVHGGRQGTTTPTTGGRPGATSF